MVTSLTIKDLKTDLKTIPLKNPFVTALHRVDNISAVRVKIVLSNGITGIGTCTPNEKVTGDNISSTKAIIEETIKPIIINKDFLNWNTLLNDLKDSVIHNSPAKAAIELALYDARRKLFGVSLTELLGGKNKIIHTDYTISIGQPQEMIEETKKRISQGFTSLKIKLANDDLTKNIKLIKDISHVDPSIHLRLDMNQAWNIRQTLTAAQAWKKENLPIDFIEQPVKFDRLDEMAYLTLHSPYPIMADESVESFSDAQVVIQKHAADYINIKLMKTGGLSEAQKINDLAESNGIKTMVGCMIESIESISAACSFALANPNVIFVDLDSIFMAELDPDLNSYAECSKNEIKLK